jgi:proline dehydrogenase
MPRWSIHPFAKTYVAGESVQETVLVVKKVNDRGFTCTLDILGEHVQSAAEAENITREYCDLYDVIAVENMNCNISIKLTHIGLALDKTIATDNLVRILKQAKKHDNFLRIDMENSPYTHETQFESVSDYPVPSSSRYTAHIKEYATEILIENPPEAIKAGMSAKVTILADSLEGALLIPLSAVVRKEGRFYCLIKEGKDGMALREIQLGSSNTTYAVLIGGLKESGLMTTSSNSFNPPIRTA